MEQTSTTSLKKREVIISNSPVLQTKKRRTWVRDGKNDGFNSLINYVSSSSGITLSPSEEEYLKQTIKARSLRRGEYLLHEGEICQNLYFIVKGALRLFSIDERGQVSILVFGIENSWITDRESLKPKIPSKYYIEALEPAEVLQIHDAQLENIARSVPALGETIRNQEREEAIATQKRILAAISMTAAERYQNMLSFNPSFRDRFSQNMLAAYLGIKPETLSRLIKRLQ